MVGPEIGAVVSDHEIVLDVDEWDCQDCWEKGTSPTCPVLAEMSPATVQDITEWYGYWDEPEKAPARPLAGPRSGLEDE